MVGSLLLSLLLFILPNNSFYTKYEASLYAAADTLATDDEPFSELLIRHFGECRIVCRDAYRVVD